MCLLFGGLAYFRSSCVGRRLVAIGWISHVQIGVSLLLLLLLSLEAAFLLRGGCTLAYCSSEGALRSMRLTYASSAREQFKNTIRFFSVTNFVMPR